MACLRCSLNMLRPLSRHRSGTAGNRRGSQAVEQFSENLSRSSSKERRRSSNRRRSSFAANPEMTSLFKENRIRLTLSEELTLKRSMEKATSMFKRQVEAKDTSYIDNMKDEMLGNLETKHAIQSLSLFVGACFFTMFDIYKDYYVHPIPALAKLNWFWLPVGLYLILTVTMLCMMSGDMPRLQSDFTRRKALMALFCFMPFSMSIMEICLQKPGFTDSTMLFFVSVVHHFPGKLGVKRATQTVLFGTVCYCLSHVINFITMGGHKKYNRLVPYFLWWWGNHIFTKMPEQLQLQNYLLTLSFDEEQELLMSSVKKSNALLERVLPRAIIPRIKAMKGGSAIADEFTSVTIMFGKVLGIHELFDKLPTVQVVEVIDTVYKRFDDLTDKHMIEKIKTVGDTYMAGAGLPEPHDDHASNMAHFAFALVENIKEFNASGFLTSDLNYKIGIASGPIVAGVIGTKNFTYDLWGDAANTASRMYSFGVKGRIQTTAQTVAFLKDEFEFESRGEINVKGKGMMEVFLFGAKREGGISDVSKRSATIGSAQVKQRNIRRQASGANPNGRRRSSIHKNAPIHMITNFSNEKVIEMMSEKENLKIGKHLWTEDEEDQCEECGAGFTLCFRRHHCRFCGRLLCDNCSSQRIYKQRSCDQCVVMKDELTDAHEMLRKAEENTKEDKLKRATINFLSPIKAILHIIRSGTLRKIEYNYNVDRKEANSYQLLLLWLLMIACTTICTFVFSNIMLNNVCLNPEHDIQHWWENFEEQCNNVNCTGVISTVCDNGKPIRAYADDQIMRFQLWALAVVVPLLSVYVFLTRMKFTLGVEMFGAVLQIAVAIILMALAIESHLYGYVFVFFLFLINVYSTLPLAVASFLTVSLGLVYIVLTHRRLCLDNVAIFEGRLCSNMADFVMEKFLHIVAISIAIGFKLETRHRGMFMKLKGIRKNQETIASEQAKQNKLIALPPVLLDGIKEGKMVVLDAYGTILFADIVSFTVFSTNMEPIRLVQILNDMFAMHDELAKRVGVDKVKTLGDCYVACSGVLSPLANHAASMVHFGLGMHWVMQRLNVRHGLNGKGPFGKDLRIRVGMSSGPIVGGVVGGKKYIFDVWGETVEDAELMESGGVPERTHVSNSTYVRASKESTLSFEPLDRLPEEGYTGGQTYLAVVPDNIELYLREICGDEDEEENASSFRQRHGSRKSSSERRSGSPVLTHSVTNARQSGSSYEKQTKRRIRESLVQVDNPLFRRGGSAEKTGEEVAIEMAALQLDGTIEEEEEEEEEDATTPQNVAGRINSMPPGLFEPMTGNGNKRVPMQIKEIV